MMRNRLNYKKQRATAVITAILIVSVISIAAITMQGYLYGELNRTQMLIDGDELINNLYDMEAWSISRLSETINNSEVDTQVKNDLIKKGLQVKSYNKKMSVNLIPQDSLFNINYLYNPLSCNNKQSNAYQLVLEKIFLNLITQKTQELGQEQIATIIKNIQNFMCSTSSSFEADSLTDYNNNPIEPSWLYQPSGQVLYDLSELNLIPMFPEALLKKISNNITALPIELKNNNPQVSININNISPELLAAIVGVDPPTAKSFLDSLVEISVKDKLTKIKEYIKEQNKYSSTELEQLNTMLSASETDSYYKLFANANKGSYQITMQTLLQISNDKKVNILWRKRGHFNG